MSPSTTEGGCTFINLTDDPEKGRDARRINVRRVVMLDYHKRRKRQERRARVLPKVPALEMSLARSGGSQSYDTRPSIRPDSTIRGPSNVGTSLLLGQLEPRSTYLFQPRRWTTEQHTQTSNLIIRFLCGQTRKAADDMSYVAFVHRQFNDAAKQFATNTSNPLKVCEQILRIHGEDSESDTALWEIVCKEQERVYVQIELFNKWELLSAAQAITLYILLWLRIGTNPPTFPCGNIALLFTLGKIFNLLKARHLHVDPNNSILQPVNDWQSWIYRESCLRTATVYFILTIVVSMDFGFSCDNPTDWRLENMPLPATKASWEANSELSWRLRVGKSLNLEETPLFRDLTIGKDTQKVSNDIWEEALDEMGLIVAMASRLPLDDAAK